MDYAFTLTIQSEHRLIYSRDTKKKFLGDDNKFLFKELTPEEQDRYLFHVVKMALCEVKGNSQDIYMNLCHPIYYKRVFNYECESHINIKMNNGEVKRHMHGTVFNFSDDDIAMFKQEVFKLLRLKVEKWQNVALKVVPIYYGSGWNDYCIKDKK